jgi:hypothetical protein
LKPCARQVRAPKIRAVQLRPAQVGLPQVGTLKPRPQQERTLEVSVSKNRPLEASVTKIGALQVGPAKSRPTKIDLYEPETIIGGLERTKGQDSHRRLHIRRPFPQFGQVFSFVVFRRLLIYRLMI